MKAKDIQVGKIYWAKVSSKIQPVRITRTYDNLYHDGKEKYIARVSWNAVNLNTGRSIWFTSAQRLRREVTDRDIKINEWARRHGLQSERRK